jgi:hypothetical protein
MNKLGVPINLSASEARSEGVLAIPFDPDNAVVLYMHEQRARIGAVVRANRSDNAHVRLLQG